MNQEQYGRVKMACVKYGKIAPGRYNVWYTGTNDNKFVPNSDDTRVCPLGALCISEPVVHREVFPNIQAILECSEYDVTRFAAGFDNPNVPGVSEWYQAGQRMRKELGV